MNDHCIDESAALGKYLYVTPHQLRSIEPIGTNLNYQLRFYIQFTDSCNWGNTAKLTTFGSESFLFHLLSFGTVLSNRPAEAGHATEKPLTILWVFLRFFFLFISNGAPVTDQIFLRYPRHGRTSEKFGPIRQSPPTVLPGLFNIEGRPWRYQTSTRPTLLPSPVSLFGGAASFTDYNQAIRSNFSTRGWSETTHKMSIPFLSLVNTAPGISSASVFVQIRNCPLDSPSPTSTTGGSLQRVHLSSLQYLRLFSAPFCVACWVQHPLQRI